MQTYKDLKVWEVNQACVMKLVRLIEQLPGTLAAKTISEQLLRSLLSVGANLAEGYSSYEGKEYARYAKISLRSAVESDHWLTTLGNIFEKKKVEIAEVGELNIETIKMLKGLIRSIEEKRESSP